jgi:hypothetical protein
MSVFKTRDVMPGSWKYPRNAKSLASMVRRSCVLVVVCRNCQNRSTLYPAEFIPRFGAECPSPHLRKFLRCKVCRSRSPYLHEASR